MNIVVIRPGAIGDTLLTFPILRALRDKFAGPHITFVGNAAVLPLALATRLVAEVADYQSPLWSELFSSAGIHAPALHSMLQATDLAICWLRDPDRLVEHNLRQAGVQQLIIAPGRPLEGERIHILAYLARTAGVSAEWAFELDAGRDAEQNDEAPIAIHPGSGGARKCWPVEKFAAVIEWLWQRRWPVLVVIGPADGDRLAYLRQHLDPPEPKLLALLVNAPLIEVAQQLKGCRCYLGNDSGVTHLAALLGLPTVALFGPSDPAVWGPVGRLVQVIYEPDLANLAVNSVVAQIEMLISH